MFDFLVELIIELLGIPLESAHDQLQEKVRWIQKKPLRIFLRVLLWVLIIAIVIGLYCVLNYLFRGYWL